MDTGERRTETFYFTVDDCDSVSIQEIARAQERSADGVAFLYDDDGENTKTAFRITRITDGRGRYFQCDGKLKIVDRVAKFETEYPLVWRPSNLGIGGFWMVQGFNHTARKIYRTPYGWMTLEDYKNNRTDWLGGDHYITHYLYSAQRKSRERRTGRGLLGMYDKSDRAVMLENEILQPYRKLHYRDKLTPYGRRIRREFAKRNPRTYAKIKQILRAYFPDDCDDALFELRFIRKVVNEPNYTRLEDIGIFEHLNLI